MKKGCLFVKKTTPFSIGSAVIAVTLLVACAFFFFWFRGWKYRTTVSMWQGRLAAMADDRALMIDSWVRERGVDASIIASNSMTLIRTPQPRYHSIYRITRDGRALPLVPECPAPSAVLVDAALAIIAGKPGRLNMFYRIPGGPVLLSLFYPVTGAGVVIRPGSNERPAWVLALVLDPGLNLYPMLSREPVPTRSGESLLTCHKQDRIVFLSPLRHKAIAPLSFSVPYANARIAARFAVDGMNTFRDYADYRGVPVYAATRYLAGVDWGLVVKIDQSEALETYYGEFGLLILSFIALISSFAGISFGLWRHNQLRSEREMAGHDMRYRLFMEQASDIIIFANEQGNIIEANQEAQRVYGYARDELLTMNVNDLCDAQACTKDIARITESSREGARLTLVHRRKDGTSFPVEASIGSATVGDDHLIINIIRDITERERVAEEVVKSLREKETLLQEVHHRVKNNMQVMSSLVNLQMNACENPVIVPILKDVQGRIHSMALVHEALYKSSDFSSIDYQDYLAKMINNICGSFGTRNDRVLVSINAHGITMGINQAIPCGLLVNELVTNALKYAFPGDRKGTVQISLCVNDSAYVLSVRDDGIGLPAEVAMDNPSTLGLRLVNILASQLRGTLRCNREGGTEFIVVFERE